MSGHIASEADVNALVKEYLRYKGLEKSATLFESECGEKGTPIASIETRPKTSHKFAAVQAEMLEMFDKGRRKVFFELWAEHLPAAAGKDDLAIQKLEFYLNIYFAIYARKHHVEDSEDGMAKFKQYIEKYGALLSRTAEFAPFYALPYAPEPETHEIYADLFKEEWSRNLHSKLDLFLKTALRALPQPRLLDLYKKSLVNGKQNEASLAKLEQRAVESEKKAAMIVKKFSKLQSDYHNVISITASLVDTLEETVQGVPVSPEYLEDICKRLFSNQIRQTTDFSRPGTAGKLLRESAAVQPSLEVLDTSSNQTDDGTLNYTKIKSDLVSSGVHYRTRALLLQALRWKLTRAEPAKRDVILAAYINNDLLGCHLPGQYRKAVLDMLRTDNDNVLLRQYTARLLNTFSSLREGRGYLAKNSDLITALMKCLETETKDQVTSEHVVACLQKLSLRHYLHSEMIDKGAINFLVRRLHDTDTMSDYMLEYSAALMLNMCLRKAGQQRCVSMAHEVLRVLINLYGNESKEVVAYVNGTLYSILAMPSIRKEGRQMGLEGTLRDLMANCGQEMSRQFEYILAALNKADDEPIDSNVNNDDVDEDDEVDQKVLEPDLDNGELLKPQDVEHIGDSFLKLYYTSNSAGAPRKKRPTDSVLATDDLLRRPVTPSRRHASEFSDAHALPSTRSFARGPSPPRRVDEIQRPPTRSGSRPSSANANNDSSTYRAASRPAHLSGDPSFIDADAVFNARPKIPRTPDGVTRPLSRGSSGEATPHPKFSDTLPTPRPGSGGRLASQPDKRTLHSTGVKSGAQVKHR